MIKKVSVNNNIPSNQMIMLQSPKVITTKIRATTVIYIVLILQKLVTILFCSLNSPLSSMRNFYQSISIPRNLVLFSYLIAILSILKKGSGSFKNIFFKTG